MTNEKITCSIIKLLELGLLNKENGEYKPCHSCTAQSRKEAGDQGCKLYAVIPAHMIHQLNEPMGKEYLHGKK